MRNKICQTIQSLLQDLFHYPPYHQHNHKPDLIFDMKNVLVVDNDPITLHILAGMLKSHSNFLKILAAQSIQTALETLDQKKIHVLITGMHIKHVTCIKHLAIYMAKTKRIDPLQPNGNSNWGRQGTGPRLMLLNQWNSFSKLVFHYGVDFTLKLVVARYFFIR